MRAPTAISTLLFVWAFALILAGPFHGVAQSAEDNSAYEQGREILFNAKTRFEYPEAIALLEQAVAENENNASAHFALAYAYTKLSKWAEAQEQVAAAQVMRDQLSAQDASWLHALDAKVADEKEREIEAWSAVTKAYPDDRWAWLELASTQMQLENFDAAAAASAKALEIEPDASKWEGSWIYYVYSKSYYRSGQYAQAVTAADLGQANATTWRSTYYRKVLGQIAAGQLDADEAVQEYRRISEAEGRNNASYTEANIALLYFELQDYANAVVYARKALEMDPGAYQHWALAYSLTENGEAEEALAVAETGLETYPDDATLRAVKGWALYRLGRYEEARTALIAAQEAAPRRNVTIELHIQAVEKALSDPSTEQAPPIPWLG